MSEIAALHLELVTFVDEKIGEPVKLDLSSSTCISIKHKSGKGSVALGAFWVRVLQNNNNYPVTKYPYKTQYSAKSLQKLILKVDDVTLSVFLTNGTLQIQGSHVLEWFAKRFPLIIRRYDQPAGPLLESCEDYAFIKEQWEKLREKDEKKKAEILQKEREKEEEALKILDDTEALVTRNMEKPNEGNETAELSSLFKNIDLNKLSDPELSDQLKNLEKPSIEDGFTLIYPLWKKLLDLWFSDGSCKVYIVTPFLDPDCLADICHLVLKHRLTSDLEGLYTRQACDHNQKIGEVKRKTQDRFSVDDRVFIEYKVFSNIIYPLNRFHCKFIACTKGDNACVLYTSANFHADHFHYSNLESVSYSKMSKSEFSHRFLRLIQASQLEVKG